MYAGAGVVLVLPMWDLYVHVWVMHTIEGVYKCMAFQSVETEPRRYVVMRSVHY